MKLWHKVIIGLVVGVIFGLIFGEDAVVVKPIGDVFINMIKMVVVPLIFFSLISGITSLADPDALGRIGVKAAFTFLGTASFAVVIGLVCANIFEPGVGGTDLLSELQKMGGEEEIVEKVEKPEAQAEKKDPMQEIKKVLIGIVPKNAIGAMADGKILQVVFFAIFTGLTLNSMGPQGKKLIDMVHLVAKLVFKMIGIIIQLSPYGVFALIAAVVGTQGVDSLLSLGKLIGTVVFACVFQYVLFGVMIAVFGRLNPMPFYKKSLEYQSLAFSTSSSKATLATTMKVCQDKIGVSNSSTSFVLPLGASINMDGTAIYLGICAVFFAQMTGTPLGFNEYMMIILTSTLASIGAAGIPGGSLIMMSMVLSTVGLPLEGVALIAGVDRVLDMLRTTINITGDATITLIVDRSENTLDEEVYYSKTS